MWHVEWVKLEVMLEKYKGPSLQGWTDLLG